MVPYCITISNNFTGVNLQLIQPTQVEPECGEFARQMFEYVADKLVDKFGLLITGPAICYDGKCYNMHVYSSCDVFLPLMVIFDTDSKIFSIIRFAGICNTFNLNNPQFKLDDVFEALCTIIDKGKEQYTTYTNVITTNDIMLTMDMIVELANKNNLWLK